MRKVLVAMFLSLDGVMEEPSWTAPFWNDEISEFKEEENRSSDALLLGRVTYEAFAGVWPTMPEAEGAEWMNSVPKFVASRTLQETTWNASLMQGNVAEEVARLKQQPGKNLLVYGSAQLVETLMQHDLVDEYRLLVYPVVLGSGKRLFKEGSQAKLQLVSSQMFSTGVVGLTYHPVREE
jgi:dihydrofolate reductase